MQNITTPHYPIGFSEKGYLELNQWLESHSFSKIFLLVDENTSQYCLPYFLSQFATETPVEIIELLSGEEHKTIETTIEVWRTLTDLGADRKSLLINLGGGVITDLGGFVASTFKRGIPFINVPTTLLGMVDACIGGKSGIDFDGAKNQIGVIIPPKFILIDTEFLSTLPQFEMRSGLAEMLKHGLIYDKNYWKALINLEQLTTNDLDRLIYESVEIKNTIVTQDPTEEGIRKSLNFGHTLGHAIESYFLENSEKPTLLHGEAVAIGMILAAHLSWQKNTLTFEEYSEIKTHINSIYPKVDFSDLDIAEIIKRLIFDKKNEYGKILFVLLDGIGRVKINQTIENEFIKKAFNDYKN